MSDFAEQMDKVWVRFAAAALESLMSIRGDRVASTSEVKFVTDEAAKYADAMLKQWEKR